MATLNGEAPLRNSDDQMPQSDKFRDLARDLECDEDEAAFEETVKRVARKEPPAEKAPNA
jgi:hypothetical protein